MKFFLILLLSLFSLMGVAQAGAKILAALLLGPLALKSKMSGFFPLPLVLPLPLPIPVHHHDDEDHEFHNEGMKHGMAFYGGGGGGGGGGGSSFIRLGSGGTHGSYTHISHSLGGGHESGHSGGHGGDGGGHGGDY